MSTTRIARFALDDSGQDLVEYAVVSGVIAVGTLTAMFVLLALMRVNYTTLQNAAQAAWEPGAPCGC